MMMHRAMRVNLTDTHTHAVSPDVDRYPRLETALANGQWWQGNDCSFERLATEISASSVRRVVLVQAAGAYGDDNTYLSDSLRHGDDRFVAVGIIDPSKGSDPKPAERLRSLADLGVAGLRLFQIPQPAVGWLGDSGAAELIDTCDELGVTVSVCCMPEAFPELATQLGRRLDVPVVLDHCGFADFTGGPPFAAAQSLWDLAAHPNLVVKFTPTLVRLNNAEPQELLDALIRHFGAERIVWGSDWPQHREVGEGGEPLTYAQQVERIQLWMSHLSPQQQLLIAGGNAARLWPGMPTS